MKVAVTGMWHLGMVTSACLSSLEFDVVGFDAETEIIENLEKKILPVSEPGVLELVEAGLTNGHLAYSSDAKAALVNKEIIWVCEDTPVDEDDIADTQWVLEKIYKYIEYASPKSIFVISSQLPVGSIAKLEDHCANSCPEKNITFVSCPENLRLGSAVNVFLEPDRIVLGCRNSFDKEKLSNDLFYKISKNLEWMSTESAEMTKHAINAFLATSVSFANEISSICESVGADAFEVSRGLKTDNRIGKKAYVRPGGPYAGGTLARDINYLNEIGPSKNFDPILMNAVKRSNDQHKTWAIRKLQDILTGSKNTQITILGLTYKTHTDTLRRSRAVEMAKELSVLGFQIKAYDPNLSKLPSELSFIELTDNVLSATEDSECMIIYTPHKEFTQIDFSKVLENMRTPNILDEAGLLSGIEIKGFNYITIGKV